jgi:hypothetical protein
VRRIHSAARHFQLRLDDQHRLVTTKPIFAGQELGTLFSGAMHEDDANMLTIAYREDVPTSDGIARLALTPQDNSDLQSGHDEEGYVSNFWFAKQNYVRPNCRTVWTLLPGGSGRKLWVVSV